MKILSLLFLFIIFNYTIFSQDEFDNNIKLAYDKFVSTNYNEAVKYFLAANKLKELSSAYDLVALADCYRFLGKNQEAVKWYNKAINFASSEFEYGNAYYNLGLNYDESGQHNKALEYFELAAKYGLLFPTKYKFEKDGWHFLTQSGRDHIYYNKKSLSKKKNGIIKIWTKWYWEEKEFTEEEILKMSKNIISEHDLVNQIYIERNGMQFSLQLMEIDCINSKNRFLSFIDYGRNAEVINNNEIQVPLWFNIVPGTIGEELLNKICDLAIKN